MSHKYLRAFCQGTLYYGFTLCSPCHISLTYYNFTAVETERTVVSSSNSSTIYSADMEFCVT